MMMVCAFLFWLVVVPFCMGHIPAYFLPRRHQNPGTVFLSGYLFEWAVFEVLAIPILIWGPGQNFHLLTRLFSIIAILLSIGGILLRLLFYKKTGRGFFADALPSKEHLRHLGAEQWVLWALFAVLLGFQLYMAITRTSFDGDDAYYVVQSLLAQETGTMYKYLPYTGGTTSLDVRHALALLPMWIAFLAVKANLHATITAHLVMPIVLIPLSYLVFYEIGTALFRKKREDIPVFLLILELLQIFGNVSIYTNETFFLTRTWQGKAVVGSVIIPSLFLLMLWIYEEKGRRRRQKYRQRRQHRQRCLQTDKAGCGFCSYACTSPQGFAAPSPFFCWSSSWR